MSIMKKKGEATTGTPPGKKGTLEFLLALFSRFASCTAASALSHAGSKKRLIG
jgi:hypothetical protein